MSNIPQAPIAPTVHNNGTSKDALLEQLIDAREKLLDAIKALENCSPHSRDYYMRGDSVWAQARDEHINRITSVRNVYDELFLIGMDVNRQ